MFQKYKYVLAVYEEKSFTEAAKKLFISQPSLSVAIHNVEKEVGAPLFERGGSGIRLTGIGALYIAAAQKMRQAEDSFQKNCADLQGLRTGILRVGGSNFLSSDVLPRIITRFRSHFPGVEITLTEANSIRLKEMLQNEELDLIVDNLDETDRRFVREPVRQEKVLLCVPGEHPLNVTMEECQVKPEDIYNRGENVAKILPVDISRFAGEKFILLKAGNDMCSRAETIFDSAGIVPAVIFRVDQLSISYALSDSGLGISFITDTFFQYRKHWGNVVLYQLTDPAAVRMLYVITKKDKYCTRAMTAFIRELRESIT